MESIPCLAPLAILALSTSIAAIGCHGPAGPPGSPGPEGVPAVYQRSTSYTCSAGGGNCNVPVLVASCDAGDFAVGGTAYRLAPGFPDQDRVSYPQPRSVATAPSGWTTSQGNMPDGHTITVVALCLDATP